MIDRREILDLAGQSSLTPHVIEKDYVPGWMLAGIYALMSWPRLLFKGGTCLKKCFFETYRFSEDLDFTLRNEAQLDEAFLKRVFAEVGAWSTKKAASRSQPISRSWKFTAILVATWPARARSATRGRSRPRVPCRGSSST